VRGTRTARGVSIEIFVKGDVITEMFVFLEPGVECIYLANSVAVFEKYFRQAIRKLRRHLVKGEKF
jgi:hypothetical protein